MSCSRGRRQERIAQLRPPHELPVVTSNAPGSAGKAGRSGDAAATLLVAAALVTVPVNDLASPMANRALVLHLCECAVIDRRHRADPFVPQ